MTPAQQTWLLHFLNSDFVHVNVDEDGPKVIGRGWKHTHLACVRRGWLAFDGFEDGRLYRMTSAGLDALADEIGEDYEWPHDYCLHLIPPYPRGDAQ